MTARDVHAAPRWLVPSSLAVGVAIGASRDVVAGFALPAALGNLAATRR